MSIIQANKRRLYPVFLGAFFGVVLIFLTAQPQHVTKASSYVKGVTSSIYSGVTKPASTYITGHEDPESVSNQYIPVSHNPHNIAASKELEDTDAPSELSSWMFTEDENLHEIILPPVSESHYLVESVSGEDGKYIEIDFLGRRGYNPNIIPHPGHENKWVLVAMQDQLWGVSSGYKAEMVCLASFEDGKLMCEDHPTTLPIRQSKSSNCDVPDGPDIIGMVGLSVGPHDARVFMGPEEPYIMYGSLSNHHNVCLGQWLQSFSTLVEWGPFQGPWNDFGIAKDIQRPPPMRAIEKNYFIFWAPDGRMFAHYDLEPRRVFAQIDLEGRAGKNLALRTAASDEQCLARWEEQSIWANGTHQATNSLSVTLRKRSDPSCKETDENTFIMSIFQKKLSYDGHTIYYPYVMLMHRTPPFAIYGITRKPLWFKGQREAGTPTPEEEIDEIGYEPNQEQHEMIYITSMDWKEKDRKYHGYLDDIVFLGFGREDRFPTLMDTTAENLIGELLMC